MIKLKSGTKGKDHCRHLGSFLRLIQTFGVWILGNARAIKSMLVLEVQF